MDFRDPLSRLPLDPESHALLLWRRVNSARIPKYLDFLSAWSCAWPILKDQGSATISHRLPGSRSKLVRHEVTSHGCLEIKSFTNKNVTQRKATWPQLGDHPQTHCKKARLSCLRRRANSHHRLQERYSMRSKLHIDSKNIPAFTPNNWLRSQG